MIKVAVLWIRDGVLVDRMHINPVAFAFTVWMFSAPQKRANTTLAELITFGFEKSGLSCADKIRLYNEQCYELVEDIAAAATYYNFLATEAARTESFFTGAPELLRDLETNGVANFITSAVEQEVLDAWLKGQQGSQIAASLIEILGARKGFSKGRDHFEYVFRSLGVDKIFYIADAAAEIYTARQYADEYGIVPVGFANVITLDRVFDAVSLVSRASASSAGPSVPFPMPLSEIQVEEAAVSVPEGPEIVNALRAAGADTVITGDPELMMQNLRNYFEQGPLNF